MLFSEVLMEEVVKTYPMLHDMKEEKRKISHFKNYSIQFKAFSFPKPQTPNKYSLQELETAMGLPSISGE